MKSKQEASLSIIRIIFSTLLIIAICSGLAVTASNSKVISVQIEFSNDSVINVFTTKTKVSEILDENNIIVLSDEKVIPSLESEISEDRRIIITKSDENIIDINEIANKETIDIQKLIESYEPITEKIETVEEIIPFETITKDASNSSSATTNKIIQSGKNGLREVTYAVKYKKDIEISREELSSKIIKEPVDKIIQITTRVISSRSSGSRVSATTLAAKVEGKEPIITTLNASAYTASTCGKSPSDPGYGRTASGAMATSYYTVAAGKAYPMGTVIYIPYFANSANGGWFVVQDRGGAISNGKVDIYMDTYSECIQFGRRNLECHIYM